MKNQSSTTIMKMILRKELMENPLLKKMGKKIP